MAKKTTVSARAFFDATPAKRKTAKTATAPKRKYTKRKNGNEKISSQLVSIQVPASLAFQLGLHLGRTLN